MNDPFFNNSAARAAEEPLPPPAFDPYDAAALKDSLAEHDLLPVSIRHLRNLHARWLASGTREDWWHWTVDRLTEEQEEEAK